MIIEEKIKEAIKSLRLADKMSRQYYNKPLQIAYSGGKDSDVLLELAKRSDIEFKVIHSHTTADAPETIYHVRDVFYKLTIEGIDTEIIKPTYEGKRTSMWELIPLQKMPPTRLIRYCCRVLKETSGKNSFIATGVRMDESVQRSNRKMFEIVMSKAKYSIRHDIAHIEEVYQEAQEMPEVYDCMYITRMKQNKKAIVNPIINWSKKELYTYIHTYKINLCSLYEKGWKRVGCIGCPMAGKKRIKEFQEYPVFKNNYIRSFDRMLDVLKSNGKYRGNWQTGEDVMDWWLST